MINIDTFVINYDPLECKVKFTILKSSGVSIGMDDGEPLKDYENTEGLFTLEGQHEKVLTYIQENFDGKSEIAMKIEVPQLSFNKREIEFKRFEQKVKEFNKTSATTVNLSIEITRLVPKNDEVPSTKKTQECKKSELQIEEKEDAPLDIKPMVKVAAVGKISSGKTELITGLTNYNHSTLEKNFLIDGTTKYFDSNNNIAWYEIAGIEYGKENVAKAKETLANLIDNEGVTIVLYCFDARRGKIEDVERDLIVDVKKKYTDVVVYAVITMCIDESASRSFVEVVSNSTKQTKIFTALAREMRTNVGYLQPFGLDEITKNIYGS